MTSKSVASWIATYTGLPKATVERVLAALGHLALEELASGGRFRLPGFGAFVVRERAARKARNPHTGESIEVPAKNALVFKPIAEMNEHINRKV